MIPIQNIFYMYCYAWGKFPEGAAIATGAEDSPDLQSLLAEVLLRSLAEIERRGIDRSYVSRSEELQTVRGHILISETMSARIRDRVSIVCEHDELSIDIPQNQVLKSTLKALLSIGLVDRALTQRLKLAVKRLSSVSDIPLTGDVFRRVRLNRNNSYYDLALKVCRLVHERLMPSERGTGSRFTDPMRDERQMARVFEDFVRNFLRIKLNGFMVTSLEMEWDARTLSEAGAPPLPRLRADILLKGSDRDVIIDTKYYRDALQARFETRTIRSAHLYQLLAYMRNAVFVGRVRSNVEGLLLYPTTDEVIRAAYTIHGFKTQICTIDLNSRWTDLERDLLKVIEQRA